MTVSRKLALLTLLALVPLIGLSAFWLRTEASRSVTEPRAALDGVRAVESLMPIVRKLEELRGLVALRAAGAKDLDDEILGLSRELRTDVARARAGVSPRLRAVMLRRLPPLGEGEPVKLAPGASPAEAVAEYQEVISELLSLVEDVGVYSGLTTSGDYRDQLYADLAVSKLPALLGSVNTLRSLGRAAAHRGDIAPDELQMLIAGLRNGRRNLQRVLMKVDEARYAPSGPGGEVRRGVESSRDSLAGYLTYVREAVLDGDDLVGLDSADFDDRSRRAIAAVSLDDEVLRTLRESHESHVRTGLIRIGLATGVTALLLLVVSVLAVKLLRDLLRKLNTAVDFSTAIAAGRRDVEIDLVARDEFGALHRALEEMQGSIRTAEARLKETNETLEGQSWVREGQVALAEIIREELAPEALAEALLRRLAVHVNATAGCVYIAAGGSIDAIAGYCLPPEREAIRLELGRGLAGQAAAERRVIRSGPVPEGALRLATCAGDAEVRDVVAMPLEFADSLVGVVELAALSPFDPRVIGFLAAGAEIVAAGLATAVSKRQVEALLEETTTQAEVLGEQREELYQANAELGLRASELEAQQLDLAEANRELQAQSELLENQKTELEETNRDLERSRLQIAEKVESAELASRYKSEFLTNMSHELRTPLNSILILARLLADNSGGRLDGEEVESALTIYGAGRDLLELINDILDISKVEAGKLVLTAGELELRDLASQLERSFAPMMRDKGLQFEVTISDGCPEGIVSDRLRVEQVLRNFLSNALKFTEKGRVTVRFDAAPSVSSGAEYAVALSVADSGIGIPAEQQGAVFEAFRQVDGSTARRYGGTGLGLSIAKALAARLGGEIAVESRVGEGSSFTLLLPARLTVEEAQTVPPAAAQPPPPPVAAVDPPKGPSPKNGVGHGAVIDDDRSRARRGDRLLLVIEDEPEFASRLVREIRASGFKAVVAADGEQGVADAIALAPSGVFLDHRLPGMSGLSVLSRLKADSRTRHIPVHVISVVDVGRDVRRLGALGFDRKPAGPETIETLIKELVASLSRRERSVLLIEDDETQRSTVAKLLGPTGARLVGVGSAEEAAALMERESFDCIVLDLKLRGESGFSFLAGLELRGLSAPPVIVYTGRQLTGGEIERLERRAGSIIIKGAKSPERLLDEVTLYLHSVEKDLPEAERAMLVRARRDGDPFSGRKVLLVDDDMRNVYSLRRVLHAWGVKTEAAETGREALARLAESTDVDLVLMDIMMPDMDGIEATRRIRGNPATSEIPVIALTAKAMKGDRDKCLAAGASDYLPKPVDVDQLLESLHRWFR